jgi:phospholipase C
MGCRTATRSSTRPGLRRTRQGRSRAGRRPVTLPNLACGDYAVNTIQPLTQPTSSNPIKLPAQTGKTIGDELTVAGVSWAWYSGGWSNAAGDKGAPGWTNGTGPTCSDPNSFANPVFPYCPNKVFQFHHQPFNYFAAYAPGTAGRTHLRDEVEFQNLVAASGKTCMLDSVSFVKPIGLENEHPGYMSEGRGSDHLVQLLQSLQNSKCASDTMVVRHLRRVRRQWDHVSPPGQGGAPGPHDKWGPGTRIPALIIAPQTESTFAADHTQYDTTSILATIEHRWGHQPLGSRDAAVNDPRPPLLIRCGRADPARLADVSRADGARPRHLRRPGRAGARGPRT